MEKKTKKTKKKNNKGFTLVELLAVIAILSIVASITIYISTNVLSSAKKKSYQVTITNIEKNANTYVTENNDKMFYISKDTNLEYQCLTVGNLIEMGYLDNNVIDSKVSDDTKVASNDYVYLERNKKTKAIQKIIYDNGTYNTTCKKAVNAEGDIVFSVYPDLNKWSKTKEVIITYRVKNYENINKYKYKYTLTDPPKNYSNASVTQPLTIDKKVTINAKILENSDTLVHKTLQISKIDNTGPTIKLTETLSGNKSGKATIPITITDTESHVDTKSVSKSDFIVTIGGETVPTSSLKLTKVEEGTDEVKYELVITDSTNIGEVIIKVAPDSIFDNVENGNKDTTIPTNITMNKVYELSNSSGKVTGYQSTLTKAFEDVPDNGTIKSLEDNTSGTAAANSKNVTLDTNKTKITLNATITNNSNKTLTIKGEGTIISTKCDIFIINNGTLKTQKVNLKNNTKNTGRIIQMNGTTTIESESVLDSTDTAIDVRGGTLTVNAGATITSHINHVIARYSTATNAATININGGTITGGTVTSSSVISALGFSHNDSKTTTLNIAGGTITGPKGIYLSKNMTINITGGVIKGTSAEGIGVTGTPNAVTITIGNKNGTFNSTSPKIIGKTVAIKTDNKAKWYWYDGELYGTNATKNYSNNPNAHRENYSPITIADKTQSGASYKSYLSPYYTLTLSAPTVTNTPTNSIKVIHNTSTLDPSTITVPVQKYTISGFETSTARKSNDATISSTDAIKVTNTFEGWYVPDTSGKKVLTNTTTPTLEAKVKNYTDDNGKWIATSDTTLHAKFIDKTVKLPTIKKTGYTCGWTTKATGTTIEYASGANYTTQKDVTMYAVCTANTNTKYVVKHYVRNLNNSQYTLDTTENKTGTTDSSLTVKNFKKAIEGFTYEAGYITGNTIKPDSGAVTTTTILGDGTRVINLYYRRNRLIIQYNANGGTQAILHGSAYGIDDNGDVYKSNSDGSKNYNFIKGVYGSKVGTIDLKGDASNAKYGLEDYNNQNYFNAEKPEYKGKEGAEWNTKSNGKGTSFNQATETYDAQGFAGADLKTGDVTVKLYINWIEAPVLDCTLVFNKNLPSTYASFIANPNPSTKKVQYNSTYGELPEMESKAIGRTGNEIKYLSFLGWATTASGEQGVNSNTKCTTGGTIQLYANWAAGSQPIDIDPPGDIPDPPGGTPDPPADVTPPVDVNPCADAEDVRMCLCKGSAEAAKACMQENSDDWHIANAAGNQEEKDRLHDENIELKGIACGEGCYFDEDTGNWRKPGGDVFYEVDKP